MEKMETVIEPDAVAHMTLKPAEPQQRPWVRNFGGTQLVIKVSCYRQ